MVLNAAFLSATLALTAAISWGAGDFTGGIATRRMGAFRTVLFGYSLGLVALTVLALARSEPLPSPTDLGWGALAGVCGMVGLGFLYRGFSSGRMGIVAPVSGVLTAGIPVIFNAFTHGLPDGLKLAGFGVALLGIWFLSRPEKFGVRPAGLGMAIMAGLGFGSFFTLLGQVSKEAVLWPLVSGRLAACIMMLLIVLLTRRPVLIRQSPWGLLTVVGVLDATGNLFFLLAVQSGRLDVAAVLASLYPAVTTLLARFILKERMTLLQVAGVAAAMLAIVMITSD